jgi:hypothetical protein
MTPWYGPEWAMPTYPDREVNRVNFLSILNGEVTYQHFHQSREVKE